MKMLLHSAIVMGTIEMPSVTELIAVHGRTTIRIIWINARSWSCWTSVRRPELLRLLRYLLLLSVMTGRYVRCRFGLRPGQVPVIVDTFGIARHVV